ncbi:hypothetical protein LCGC14_0466570 [marine sediment metagenome]|uniref:Siphovirus-type tail component C-terminal domain-containing protein n=1 Tax=marine sediment metagenome TaxID=412755 RepID=A0A0F9SWI3_9ZZZZ
MIKKEFPEYNQYIASDGTVLDFESEDKFLTSWEGWGLPPIEYITQRGPTQHGATVVDFRLQTRIVQMVLRNNGCSRYDYWEDRSTLIDAIRPNRHNLNAFGPGVLRKYLPDGSIRDLDVLIQKGPIFQSKKGRLWDEHGFTEPLRFIAHNPIIYDPVEVCLEWTLATSDQLVFDTSFGSLIFHKDGVGDGLRFGSDVIDSDRIVSYVGTWFTFPTIEITGPLSGFIITNLATNQFIRLNYVISAGEVVTIGLQYGNKVVQNNLGISLIGTVTTDSNLVDFHIAERPIAPNGINTLRVLGGGANVNTAVQVAYFTKYIGI